MNRFETNPFSVIQEKKPYWMLLQFFEPLFRSSTFGDEVLAFDGLV